MGLFGKNKPPQLKVKIKFNHPAIVRITKAQRDAAKETVEAMKTDILQSKKVPKDTGFLEDSIDIKKRIFGGMTIIYNTPYARRLYFHPEYNFSTRENENAQGKWLEDYTDGSKQNFVNDTYEAAFKRRAGL